MKIILAGGGTLGSVSPLIAIWQKLKAKDENLDAFFIGTKKGPEKELVNRYQIPFKYIISGKFRRYFSLLNIIDLFKIILGIIQSLLLLKKIKPDAIVSAGGFIAVPLIWASRFYKTKVILYQSDLKIGLANKLCQKRADYIFTAFSETVSQFSKKAEVAGTVLREEIAKVESRRPTRKEPLNILILGGGIGSQKINQLAVDSIKQLSEKFKIIHMTGKNKRSKTQDHNYQSFEFLTDDYYQKIAEADLVISRAGLSTLMELSYLAKPAILIPLPDSAQEKNAEYLCQKKSAIYLNQKELNSEKLITAINQAINDKGQLANLADNIHQIFLHGGEEKIAQRIYELK
ncbi:UDP-N-acetylglucosamine--N-acetylmuramyl-(pentapeptide) pyrophosphoryl-undecaprenol N-acetylglucosamine transferase [Patescibacteria group bacterium]|nr:UDP-N-acetylglucosamine--N-acetylmuramyl-(pentapeptide) pyrophosphoryl-undecaprenol N-acetylglucosamine transferase [Patescibacteria group bacterium]